MHDLARQKRNGYRFSQGDGDLMDGLCSARSYLIMGCSFLKSADGLRIRMRLIVIACRGLEATLQTDQIRTIFVSLEFVYAPLPHFDRNALPQLYAELCRTLDFDLLEQSAGGEGCRMSFEDLRLVTFGLDHLSIEEKLEDDITLSAKRIAEVSDLIRQNFEIARYEKPRITLRALWPYTDQGQSAGSAAAAMRRAFQMSDD